MKYQGALRASTSGPQRPLSMSFETLQLWVHEVPTDGWGTDPRTASPVDRASPGARNGRKATLGVCSTRAWDA